MNREEVPSPSGPKGGPPVDNGADIVMTAETGKATTSTTSSTQPEGQDLPGGLEPVEIKDEVSDSSSDSIESTSVVESTTMVNSVIESDEPTYHVPITTSSLPEDLEAELKQVLFENIPHQIS